MQRPLILYPTLNHRNLRDNSHSVSLMSFSVKERLKMLTEGEPQVTLSGKQASPQKPTCIIKPFDVACMILAELIGTCMLLFFGCMGTVKWVEDPNVMLGPLNFGLTVMMIIQTFGHISFALLNPAITFTAFMCKLLPYKVSESFPFELHNDSLVIRLQSCLQWHK